MPAANAQTPCPSPPPIRGAANGNIFSEQQEMDLGDALHEQYERNLNGIQDNQLNQYLNRIAQRLLAHMPPTQLKFHIVLVDLPVANAFTFPGGRIYVTRKLVAFAQSEDELAAVIGHELGHALTHQPAANYSRALRQVLGVKQVGDRADVFLKYNQLIEKAAERRLPWALAENRQAELVADSYGLYAMAGAGYLPEAMVHFWNRLAQTQNKTGNWLTDLFGTTTPDEERLRAMRKYIVALPPSCVAPKPSSNSVQFRAWQRAVIAYTVEAGKQSLPGLLWKRPLSPPLESEITNVRFSPDGKYLLAQDDFSVYVLSRQPLKPLFRIPADDVEPAGFTPDSQSVLIWTHALRVEKWNVATRNRTEVHEVVAEPPCVQTDLSSDGTLAACVQGSFLGGAFDVSLLDVETSAPVLEKKNFYHANFDDAFVFLLLALTHAQVPFFHLAFSPDGRYFAVARNLTSVAWDLKSKAPVKLSSADQRLMSGGFTFIAPHRIVGINEYDPRKSGSADFPLGPAGKPIPLPYGLNLAAPARSPGLQVRPAKDYAVALVDLNTGNWLLSSKVSALDVYDDIYSRPQPDGSIGIFDLSTRKEIASSSLLGHWIGPPQTADVSADLKWFVASGKTRGAVWDLSRGTRVLHVRGFSGSAFSSQDNLYGLFNSHLKEKRSIGVLNPLTGSTQAGAPIDDNMAIAQVGPYFLYFRRQKGKWRGPFDLQVYDRVLRETCGVESHAEAAENFATCTRPRAGYIELTPVGVSHQPV